MPAAAPTRLEKIRKLVRFARIYGLRRATVKAMGRLRMGRMGFGRSNRDAAAVGIIGCGQFAFSTIAYFLRGAARLTAVFDVRAEAASSLARTFGVGQVCASAADLMGDETISCVYVASNHASHAGYARQVLAAGKDVYVEKPVAVNHDQLASLSRAVQGSVGRCFAGYNRPFSGAVRDLRRTLGPPRGLLTLSCFVSGHVIPADHWYRRADEGTRICGNVGHWLDLAVHMVSWRHLPDRWRIVVIASNGQARDDDVCINLVSDAGDLVNIVLTSRTEPFEGINETINVQWDDVIAKIDDFRRQTIWQGPRLIKKRYWPKDVGHRAAVRQPFSAAARAWREIEDSTLLMLRIAEMVRAGEEAADFSFAQERRRIDAAEPAGAHGGMQHVPQT